MFAPCVWLVDCPWDQLVPCDPDPDSVIPTLLPLDWFSPADWLVEEECPPPRPRPPALALLPDDTDCPPLSPLLVLCPVLIDCDSELERLCPIELDPVTPLDVDSPIELAQFCPADCPWDRDWDWLTLLDWLYDWVSVSP
jgi:hypothetical protein